MNLSNKKTLNYYCISCQKYRKGKNIKKKEILIGKKMSKVSFADCIKCSNTMITLVKKLDHFRVAVSGREKNKRENKKM